MLGGVINRMEDLLHRHVRSSEEVGQVFPRLPSFRGDFLGPLGSFAQALLFKTNWRILIFLAALILGLLIEDRLGLVQDDSWNFYGQVFLILLLLLTTGFLIHRLQNALADRSRVIRILDWKNKLAERLASAVDPQDVYRQILQFTAQIFPSADTALYIHDEEKRELDRISQPELVRQPGLVSQPELAPSGANSGQPVPYGPFCVACLSQEGRAAHPLISCKLAPAGSGAAVERRSCLALIDNNRLVGALSIQAPNTLLPTREQADLLEAVQNEISGTLAAVLEKKRRAEIALAQAVVNVQIDIARDLHDTLAQNIAYLRMVLENMAEMSPRERARAGAEVRKMHAVAEESCDLVRGTLAALQAGELNETELENIFSSQARVIAERQGIEIQVASHGTPVALPSKVVRQLFYIFREILSNIEKHAGASRVGVDFLWKPGSLILNVTDDGVGFDPRAPQAGSHYGLKFMRSRVNNLQGVFSLHSAPGSGACITIWLPVEPSYAPADCR